MRANQTNDSLNRTLSYFIMRILISTALFLILFDISLSANEIEFEYDLNKKVKNSTTIIESIKTNDENETIIKNSLKGNKKVRVAFVNLVPSKSKFFPQNGQEPKANTTNAPKLNYVVPNITEIGKRPANTKFGPIIVNDNSSSTEVLSLESDYGFNFDMSLNSNESTESQHEIWDTDKTKMLSNKDKKYVNDLKKKTSYRKKNNKKYHYSKKTNKQRKEGKRKGKLGIKKSKKWVETMKVDKNVEQDKPIYLPQESSYTHNLTTDDEKFANLRFTIYETDTSQETIKPKNEVKHKASNKQKSQKKSKHDNEIQYSRHKATRKMNNYDENDDDELAETKIEGESNKIEKLASFNPYGIMPGRVSGHNKGTPQRSTTDVIDSKPFLKLRDSDSDFERALEARDNDMQEIDQNIDEVKRTNAFSNQFARRIPSIVSNAAVTNLKYKENTRDGNVMIKNDSAIENNNVKNPIINKQIEIAKSNENTTKKSNGRDTNTKDLIIIHADVNAIHSLNSKKKRRHKIYRKTLSKSFKENVNNTLSITTAKDIKDTLNNITYSKSKDVTIENNNKSIKNAFNAIIKKVEKTVNSMNNKRKRRHRIYRKVLNNLNTLNTKDNVGVTKLNSEIDNKINISSIANQVNQYINKLNSANEQTKEKAKQFDKKDLMNTPTQINVTGILEKMTENITNAVIGKLFENLKIYKNKEGMNKSSAEKIQIMFDLDKSKNGKRLDRLYSGPFSEETKMKAILKTELKKFQNMRSKYLGRK